MNDMRISVIQVDYPSMNSEVGVPYFHARVEMHQQFLTGSRWVQIGWPLAIEKTEELARKKAKTVLAQWAQELMAKKP